MPKQKLSPNGAYSRLKTHAERISADPQTNSVHGLALEYFRDLTDKRLSLSDLDLLASEIGSALQQERADRFRLQHFPKNSTDVWRELKAELEDAAVQGFSAFQKFIQRRQSGIVFTAHPTFAHSPATRANLARQATIGAPPENTNARADESSYRITLDQEHAEAQAAIENAKASIAHYLSIVMDVAAENFPDDWQSLRPTLPTVASWVGYDLDGRTDIHWSQSVVFRLTEKAAQLDAYKAQLNQITEQYGANKDVAALVNKLSASADQARLECNLFAGDMTDVSQLVEVAEALSASGEDRLTDGQEISEAVDALARAEKNNLERAKALYSLARQIELIGLGTAHIHLRINAAQIQTVLFRDLGLSTEHREFGRVALETLAEKAEQAEKVETDITDLFLEKSTARRQFILCAQILKFIDSRVPIRFLIAESENPATIMGAIYLARQYGVAEQLDISPLFETPDALENGGRFIERLLGVPAYRDYVEKRQRLSIQLGFSDAGRFIGQVAANMAIERIHNLIARKLAEILPGVDLLVFNTHGESMGRGGYPGDFEKRMDHLLTPWTRARCQKYGLKLIHEVSFQGGDGYIHFASSELSDATLSALLQSGETSEGSLSDPFYIETNFVWDFYRSLRAWHERLFHNDDYATLISAFAGGFLVPAGSRPRRRSTGPAGPASLRAISHNATLQQLGVPVNTAGGVGSALRSETDQLADLIDRSPRLHSLINLAVTARVKTSVPALRAYAVVYSPTFWIAASKREEPRLSAARRRVAFHLRDHQTSLAVTKCADGVSVDLGRFDRLIAKLENAPSVEERHKARLPIHALHAVRQAAMMFALQTAGDLPEVSTRHGFDIADVFKLIEEMQLADAIALLEKLFPISQPKDEKSLLMKYRNLQAQDHRMTDYQNIHQFYIEPLRQVHNVIRTTSLAIAHAYGAYG